MPHLELSLHCPKPALACYETALEEAGALALTLLDAAAGTTQEHAILEPAVGEVPVWDTVSARALFAGDTDALALLATLNAAHPGLDWDGVRFRLVDDEDWERAWMDQFQPMRFGQRLWVVPWNHALPEQARSPQAAIVRLDPGLAFGSGTHPTTALCLEWLDALAVQGSLADCCVLDVGCGSGILALAALRLGAAEAIGIDNDPQALVATTDNARRNGLSIATCRPEDAPQGHYPVLLANILASTLEGLAEQLATWVCPGGYIALSGILAGQEHDVMARYAPWFAPMQITRKGDWVRVTGQRKPRLICV